MKKLIFLLSLILYFACTSETKKSDNIEYTYPKDPYWSDLSLFLAGKELSIESPFYAISQRAFYKDHARKVQKAHAEIKKNHLDKIIPWVEKNTQPFTPQNTVLYPLSGADFINLYHFYPNSKHYYMIGLEHPGDFVNPLSLDENSLKKGLSSLETMTVQMAQLNYFISKNMRNHFSNQYYKGVAPMLIVFMTNLGLEVQYFEKVRLLENGFLEVISEYSNNLMNRSDITEGVRVYFYDKTKNQKKILTFLRMYINPDSYLQSNYKGKFFIGLPKTNLILKSAEYLFHRPEYENFVNFLVKKSDMLIQDDTGFPFRYFNNSSWNINLYGTYSKQFILKGVYLKSDQPDLLSSYKEKSQLLPFKYGYGVLKGESQSNLGVYRRKEK
jgi:hypothetical protein